MKGRLLGALALLTAVAGPAPVHAQPAQPHQHPVPAPPETSAPADDHAAHQAGPPPLPPFIPPVTDEDRAAAFPDAQGHVVHDTAINYFVLFDQLEWQHGAGVNGLGWDAHGWIGQDRHRFWFRTEGGRVGGRTEDAQTDLLYGRAVARWWDVTAGLRLDTLPDTPRTALALGVRGLAPQWFEVEASAYLEPSGRAHVRLETQYELLITNRLVLQPLLEAEIYGRDDRERRVAAGLSTGELGLRLRYVVRRELAPYIGVVWTRRFFGSADLARAGGEDVAATRLAVGVRTWF